MAATVELEAVNSLFNDEVLQAIMSVLQTAGCHSNPVGQTGEKSLSGSDLAWSVV